MPRDLWRWAIAVGDIADLSTADKLAGLDLPVPRPGRRTWAAFQVAGERLNNEGHRGVLYPSAARPDHKALCLFCGDLLISGADPLRPPTTHRDPPAPPTGMHT
jgi:hypothetical protein